MLELFWTNTLLIYSMCCNFENKKKRKIENSNNSQHCWELKVSIFEEFNKLEINKRTENNHIVLNISKSEDPVNFATNNAKNVWCCNFPLVQKLILSKTAQYQFEKNQGVIGFSALLRNCIFIYRSKEHCWLIEVCHA